MPTGGSTLSPGLFFLGLIGVALMVAGGIVASGRRKEHWLGGVLLIVGLMIVTAGWLAPASQ